MRKIGVGGFVAGVALHLAVAVLVSSLSGPGHAAAPRGNWVTVDAGGGWSVTMAEALAWAEARIAKLRGYGNALPVLRPGEDVAQFFEANAAAALKPEAPEAEEPEEGLGMRPR